MNTPIPAETTWILWNPDSDRPPRQRYSTKAEAIRVAQLMVERHGESFYVMQLVAVAQPAHAPVKVTHYVPTRKQAGSAR